VITGYLPSVTLLLSLYTVPPLMMLFSSIEGSISRSGRKRSGCLKILFFNIWNVFFVNVLSGSVLNQLNVFSRPKDMPTMLAELVPKQVMAGSFIFFFVSCCDRNANAGVFCSFMLVCKLTPDGRTGGCFSAGNLFHHVRAHLRLGESVLGDTAGVQLGLQLLQQVRLLLPSPE
jgi:hypothetical protein